MILFDTDVISERVTELAEKIDQAYEDGLVTAGREGGLVVLVVLDGAFVFAADLLRRLTTPIARVAFIRARSYQGAKSDGTVHLDWKELGEVRDRHVLVVEDIVDSGRTATALWRSLKRRGVASLRMAALLDKVSKRDPQHHFVPEFTGFECPDAFVVGYGLDVDGLYRDLPWISDATNGG